jgi:enoyl-CoA hydratase
MRVEDRPGGVRVLTLDNPTRRNALDEGMLDGLFAALAPEATRETRAILLRGDGKAFCAGYDLTSLSEVGEGKLPDTRLGEVFARLERHPAPSVALLTGGAFGAGCELACACDFRIGSDQALFCMPPAKLGVVYAPEGLFRLTALAGRSKAKLMVLTGRKIDAARSLEWGLLDELHVEGAEAAAFALVTELAAAAPLAVRGMKRGFELVARAQLSEEERGELETLRREAFNSADAREGRAAFLEKRAPRFEGR